MPLASPEILGTMLESETQLIREQLRAAGLRATFPRIAVFQALRRAKSPLSHPELSQELEKLGFDKVTVYRNLLDLASSGLARKTDVGDHVWRFEAASTPAGRKEVHPHFLCSQCGLVSCLGGVRISTAETADVPRSVKDSSVEILVRGLCDSCAAGKGQTPEETE